MISLKPGSSTMVNGRIEEHDQWTNFSLNLSFSFRGNEVFLPRNLSIVVWFSFPTDNNKLDWWHLCLIIYFVLPSKHNVFLHVKQLTNPGICRWVPSCKILPGKPKLDHTSDLIDCDVFFITEYFFGSIEILSSCSISSGRYLSLKTSGKSSVTSISSATDDSIWLWIYRST